MHSIPETLASASLLQGLDPADLASLAELVEHRRLEAGATVFREGERSRALYLIASGTIEIVVAQPDDGTEHVLAELGPGSECGEMAFLDGSPRSATARATRACELLELDHDRLLASAAGRAIVDRLAARIARSGAERLKLTNRNYVASLERQIETLRLQHEFGQFFVYMLACYAIGTLINVLLHSHLQDVDIYARTFSWSYLVVLLLPSLVIVRMQRIPLARLGVTLVGWQRSLREGLFASALFVALCVVFVAVNRTQGWLELPALTGEEFTWVPSYLVHSAIQEFLARGIVQNSFQRFFADEKGTKSVWLASALFSLFHVHFGLEAVLITLGSGVVFGHFYLRHHNLIGVSVLHGVAGSCMFLLGLL